MFKHLNEDNFHLTIWTKIEVKWAKKLSDKANENVKYRDFIIF